MTSDDVCKRPGSGGSPVLLLLLLFPCPLAWKSGLDQAIFDAASCFSVQTELGLGALGSLY